MVGRAALLTGPWRVAITAGGQHRVLALRACFPDRHVPCLGPCGTAAHVNVDAEPDQSCLRTIGTERCRGDGASKDKGGRDRGRFGPGATTVPVRSSGLSRDPQRPGGGGGG